MRRRQLGPWSGALLVFAVLAVAACQPQTKRPTTSSAPAAPAPASVQSAATTDGAPRRVGLLVPLTGRAANVGKDLLRAAEMAVFDYGGPTLELYPRDTKSTGEGAVAAASELIAQNQVQVIVGPLFGASAVQIRPIANNAGVPVLSFSSQSQIGGDGVYAIGYRPEEQVVRVTRHAISQGRTRFAALAPDDDYGRSAVAALQAAVAADPQASVVASQTYSASGSDANAKLGALTGRTGEAAAAAPATFDALLLADGGDRLRRVGDSLPSFGLVSGQVALLGTMLWQDDPAILQSVGLRGARYAGMPEASLRGFRNRFRAVFGTNPAPLAILAYDAVGLAAVAAAAPAGQRTQVLQDSRGFDGLAGIVRLLPSGVAEHGLAIYETTPQGPRVVDPAPSRFDDGVS